MILIISNSFDKTTYNVIEWIRFYNQKFLLLHEKSKIIDIEFCLTNNKEEMCLTTSSGKLNLYDIKAVWYRRGEFLYSLLIPVSCKYPNIISQNIRKFVSSEIKSLQLYIYAKLCTRFQINKPSDANINKLQVLAIAKSVGLNIPSTFITTNPNQISEESKESYISKSISEVTSFFYGNYLIINHTTEVEVNKIKKLPFPALLQTKIIKQFEVRSLFLNKKFYSIAIFSQLNERTKTDYRKYDFQNPNRRVVFQLPDNIERKLKLLMKKLNLLSGSVDLIYDIDGKFIFLEINPVGQFASLNKSGNYNIDKLIAKILINETNRKKFRGIKN